MISIWDDFKDRLNRPVKIDNACSPMLVDHSTWRCFWTVKLVPSSFPVFLSSATAAAKLLYLLIISMNTMAKVRLLVAFNMQSGIEQNKTVGSCYITKRPWHKEICKVSLKSKTVLIKKVENAVHRLYTN